MRVAIHCRSFLTRQYTGIGRYAYHLVKSLGEIDKENQYLLYARKGLFSFHKRIPKFKSKNVVAKIDFLKQGVRKCLGDFDIYHMPSPGPIPETGRAKLVVTVHDLIFKSFPQGHTLSTIKTGEEQLKVIRLKADKIICCSQSTIDDLKKFYSVPAEKIDLIYQGVDKDVFYPIEEEEKSRALSVLKKLGLQRPYLLFVGTVEPRKNLKNILKAFKVLIERKQFDGQLVVVGMKGWMSDDLNGLIERMGLRKSVVFLGYMTDECLRWLYNLSRVFVFPSFYEGFGFPILEAFCCGTPVVTSNVSSCAEVAGDGALTVSPHEPEEIADALARVLGDEALRAQLKEKGWKRAADFSFIKTARETLEVYKNIHIS